jgi:D-inositol-3-phosphate glycosyltransferase
MRAPVLDADIIVSHMSACWANVPFFTSLRGQNPESPLVHVEHSYSQRFVAANVAHRGRFEDLLSLCYSLFDRIVAVSEPQAAWILRRHYCLPEQLTTISSCVPLGPFRAVAGTIPQGPVTVGAFGRFHKQKGFDILVDAFSRLRGSDIRLLLVGDGEEEDNLRKLTKNSGNIVFQDRTDSPADAMALCDVVAMPSRWEPYGLVALEASAACRPVLCSTVDGLMQHIRCGAVAMGENTPQGWSMVLSELTDRRAVSALPVSMAADGAEERFIRSWRDLVTRLCTAPEIHDLAA